MVTTNYKFIYEFRRKVGSARGDQGERTGAGAPPVADLGIIG